MYRHAKNIGLLRVFFLDLILTIEETNVCHFEVSSKSNSSCIENVLPASRQIDSFLLAYFYLQLLMLKPSSID